MLPAIFGLSGLTLTADERAFFREADPAGYILFARNCSERAQVRALTNALRELSGRDRLPILVDQEGGRVARLGPPAWPEFPAPGRFAELYARAPISALEAARVNAAAIAVTLAEVGITVNCLPLLDLRHPGGHEVIGERALGAEPMQVAALGRMVIEGLAAGGVAGIVKHMPGHGRARADSHRELPVVDVGEEALEADLAPFRSLAWARIGMTAHILYPAWDAERPATLSPTIIEQVIRGRIGFGGLLVTDDLDMAALSGSLRERGASALGAGCDLVLHCSGSLGDNLEIAEGLSSITPAARKRLAEAMETKAELNVADYEPLASKRDALLAAVAPSRRG